MKCPECRKEMKKIKEFKKNKHDTIFRCKCNPNVIYTYRVVT